MIETEKETFGNFDFAKALEFLNLFPYLKWEVQVSPIQASEALKVNLKRAERQVTTGANEWDQRLFMELIYNELRNKRIKKSLNNKTTVYL